MKIGIISDSHDNLPHIKKAVRLFNAEGVDHIIHAGDYVAPFAVKELLNADAEITGIFGNNDGEQKGIKVLFENIFYGPHTICLNDKKITIVHDINNLDSESREISDVVIYGHTHSAEIRKESDTLFLNPGECGGWLSGNSTVALLDIDCMDCRIVTIS